MPIGSAIPRRWRWRVGLAMTAAVTTAALTASSAPAATPPPAPSGAPTITNSPSAVTSSTTARFTYQHTQSGVTFQCSLDNENFRSCASSGITYNSLSSGAHRFRVAARNGSSALSPAAGFTWTIDRTPPTVTMTSPTGGATYDLAGWAAVCGAPAATCGTAADTASGVTEVRVAVLRTSTGRYWNGTDFTSGSPQYLPATGTTSWRLPVTFASDGQYQTLVRATDGAGNQTSGSGVRTTFTYDTSVPIAPVITDEPDDFTESTDATFRFRLGSPSARSGSDGDDDDENDDDDDDASFECSLDGSTFRTCESPKRYRDLGLGQHCFDVRHRTRAGRVGPPTRWCWTIIVDQGFPISGDIDDPFLPGLSRTVDVSVTNPYPFALRVFDVKVAVAPTTSQPGCAGTTNLVPTRQLTQELVIPANSTRRLSELGVPDTAWPELTMPNLPVSQDACRLARMTLRYSGKATKA